MKLKKILRVKTIVMALIFYHTVAFGNEFKLSTPSDTTLQICEIEIIDSVIYKMLDSIIEYAEYCHGRHNKVVTHYEILPSYRVRYNDVDIFYSFRSFSAYSSTDARLHNINTNEKVFILKYKKKYFFLNISDINDFNIYMRPTAKKGVLNISKDDFREEIIGGRIDSEDIKLKMKSVSSLGKTYMIIDGEINNNSIRITGNWCMCYYGKLSRFSRFLQARKLIYNVFCPCRGKRRM